MLISVQLSFPLQEKERHEFQCPKRLKWWLGVRLQSLSPDPSLTSMISFFSPFHFSSFKAPTQTRSLSLSLTSHVTYNRFMYEQKIYKVYGTCF